MDTAKDSLKKWLNAWKYRSLEQMLKYTQITWKEGIKDSDSWLKQYMSSQNLKSFNIIGYKKYSGVMVDFDVKILVKYPGKKAETETRKIRLMKEIELNTPSEDGIWGVNPASSLRRVA